MRRDYEPDVSQILALYQQLEDDILASMTKRMLKMGYVSESTKYQAEILQSAGLLREDVAQMIAQRTDASVQQVKALFEDAGVETVRIDNEIYREAGIVPIDIRQDEGMRNLLEEGYRRTLGTMQNLTGTTAAQTEQQFVSACDRAYMQVSSGAFSYQEAIMTAVRGFADVGAEVVYPSGHRDKLDVAVRRAVLTGVGQATAAVSLKHADEAGCYLMELSAHSGARPGHAEWQGQLVSRTGKNAGRTIDGLYVYTLDQIGYGTGRGFKGWNCRHNWYPYYEGFSKPNYTKQQIAALNAKNIPYNGQMYSEYEISQMQRTAERKIRKLKRRLITAQESIKNAPDDATRASAQNYYNRNAVKLKDAECQLRDLCNQTGQWNDKFRTQVSGFGQSEAQKAVWANRKAIIPQDKSSNSVLPHGKIAKTPEVLQKTAEKIDKFLDDYATRKSKWSGNAFRMTKEYLPKAMGRKEWDCSITIREDADIKTVIHELLHARSCSYFSKIDFRKHRLMEEVTVELYAQEICKKHGIPFDESYPLFVGYLREINRIAKIEENNFDFGRKLLDMDMKMRYNWIKEQSDKANISPEMQYTLKYLLEQLREGELS